MSTSDDVGGRHLSEERLEEIFQEAIVETLVYPGLPLRRDDPEMALVVAQTGAGTGHAHTQLNDEFRPQGGVVRVVTDEFRSYHPDYQWLVALRPEALREHTEQAARWWQDRAIEHLVVRGYNVAFEDRFGSPDSVLDTAKTLSERAGYKVRVSAVVTPSAISRLGIIETFAQSVGVGGTGPWVSAEEHDASYSAVVETLARAEITAAVGRITLHTADGVLFDRQRDPAGIWEPDNPSSVDVLVDARNEPMTRVQRTALSNRLSRTLEQLAEAGIGQRAIFDMGGEVIQDLAGYPLSLDGRTVARLNTAMVGVLDADTGPRDPLDAAMDDLRAANQHLDSRDPDVDLGPLGPDLPPPEPPGPDLGPEP